MQQEAGSSGLEKPSSVNKPAWILMSLGKMWIDQWRTKKLAESANLELAKRFWPS